MMIIKPHHGMSLLILASAAQLRADCDWKDIATAGLIGAGIGAACVYAANSTDNTSSYSYTSYNSSCDTSCCTQARMLKRNADAAYDKIAHANYRIIDSYIHASFECTRAHITRKGKEYQPQQWYIASSYRNSDCREYTPLLRGYAALLNDAEELRMHRNELVAYFGSRNAARCAYDNFAPIESLLTNLERIATVLEHSVEFRMAREDLRAYRTYQEDLERTRRALRTRPVHTMEAHYNVNVTLY